MKTQFRSIKDELLKDAIVVCVSLHCRYIVIDSSIMLPIKIINQTPHLTYGKSLFSREEKEKP